MTVKKETLTDSTIRCLIEVAANTEFPGLNFVVMKNEAKALLEFMDRQRTLLKRALECIEESQDYRIGNPAFEQMKSDLAKAVK